MISVLDLGSSYRFAFCAVLWRKTTYFHNLENSSWFAFMMKETLHDRYTNASVSERTKT